MATPTIFLAGLLVLPKIPSKMANFIYKSSKIVSNFSQKSYLARIDRPLIRRVGLGDVDLDERHCLAEALAQRLHRRRMHAERASAKAAKIEHNMPPPFTPERSQQLRGA